MKYNSHIFLHIFISNIFPLIDKFNSSWHNCDNCVYIKSIQLIISSNHNAGLKVTFDLTKPNGQRVIKVKVKDCYSCSTYKDLEMEKMYDVVTQSYLVDGGDGYTVLRNFKDYTVPIGQWIESSYNKIL